jgi:hypothetical protein
MSNKLTDALKTAKENDLLFLNKSTKEIINLGNIEKYKL